jgi:hypothetical protein
VESDTSWAVERLQPSGADGAAPLGGAARPLSSFLDGAEAVLVRYDGKDISPSRAAALLRYLEGGGGVLFWIDPNGNPPAETPLSKALGLTYRIWNDDPGASAAAELTLAGATHEVTLLGGDAASAAAIWKGLPPVRPPVLLGAQGGRLTPILAGRLADGVAPLLFAGRIGAGRVAVLNAAGVYRWGLTAGGLGGAAGIDAALFGGLARWLASADDDRAVRLSAPDITPEGRAIALRLTSTVPLGTEARATVRARRVGGRAGNAAAAVIDTTLERGEGGDFSGGLTAPPGTYVLSGRVTSGGRAVGGDSLRVAVGAQGIEYESLAAEPDILARAVAATGGVSAPLTAPAPVLDRLRSPDIVRSRLAEIDLFHDPYLFAIIVIGLAVEWALRRRFHLM